MSQDRNERDAPGDGLDRKLALSWEKLRKVSDPADFPYETTADMEPLLEVFGQDRAVSAIEFGLDISSSGYNLFLAGPPGTGKTIILKRLLGEIAATRPVPDDVCYVHNFEDPDTPVVIRLPAGQGRRFRCDMEELVRDMRELVPKAFEDAEYENEARRIAEQNQQQRKRLFEKLAIEAKSVSVGLQSTPMGVQAFPVADGKPLTEEAYAALSAKERETIDMHLRETQTRILSFVSEVKRLERELRKEIKEFNDRVAMNVLGALVRELRERYSGHDDVLAYIDAVQRDILESIDHFRQQEEGPSLPGLHLPQPSSDFTRYEVNVIVDNATLEGAPVVMETNPTYNNLVGRIDRRAQFGALITDFTMIRAGSLARASGGYLVVNIEDVLRNPQAYEALKRAVKNKEVAIEELAERIGLFSSQTLRPGPMPLDIKVCLIGNPTYYHLLYAFDEDFRECFKVKADFDFQSDRSQTALEKFGSFVARLVDEEKLPHFDRTGVCAIVDESSRRVEDQEKVSLQFGEINDLIRQAAYWARREGSELARAEHVRRAVEEIEFRSSLVRERVLELTERGVIAIETEGERNGDINGLAVHMLGDYLFGRPTRISARVALGSEGVINIERRANLSHSTHDKGVLILNGFLADRFAQETPLSMSATLTFEQSYAEVSGDSASSTELYALLSAIADVPIRQGIAVTGSVNQRGEVQAIGGVNYKIEGFFDLCAARGFTGDQGVLIPRANVQHLMLEPRVVDAVREGHFHIWAVDHVDQGIELLTGVPAGALNDEGEWEEGSIGDLVSSRIVEYHEKLQGKQDGQVGPSEILIVREEDLSELPPPPPRPPGRPPS